MNPIEWIFSLPLYLSLPAYILIGVLVGANLKFWMAHHLWAKHHAEDRDDAPRSCWCGTCDISRGDFITFGMWASPILWPIVLAVMVAVAPFLLYSKILRFVHVFAQKGAKRTWVDRLTMKELRSKVGELSSELNDIRSRFEAQVKSTQDSTKRANELAEELRKLKEPKEADVRVDRVLEKTQQLLGEMDRRPPEEQV